jgi:hypothetical protein
VQNSGGTFTVTADPDLPAASVTLPTTFEPLDPARRRPVRCHGYGAFQQSLESLRRFDEDEITWDTSRASRELEAGPNGGLRRGDETVDAANRRWPFRSVRCGARIRCEELAMRFGLWAVGAWPERTDAILTELGQVNRPVGR